jgi:predicted nuclease of restriction endonuclease-like (RecB) superfamily
MNKPIRKPSFVKRSLTVAGEEYGKLLQQLKDRFRKSQVKAAVRVNTTMLEYYWDMGREISKLHAEAKWGSAFFECLSLDLKAEFPRQTGFSTANIRYTKRWYEFYNAKDMTHHQVGDEILQRPVEEFQMPVEFGLVPWGQHIDIFTRSKSVAEALFYIEETIKNHWSRPELSAEIDAGRYKKRGAVVTNFDNKLPTPYSGLAKDILKSPYKFDFVSDQIKYEHQLEDALASNISRFLLELGSGFAYVGRQMELQMPKGQVFVPDMIFYHIRLKAYIVLEIKVVEYIPEFAGKLNFYVSAVDELMKQDDDNPTIGLLICKSKDDTVVEWSFRGMNQPLGVAEYQLRKDFDKITAMLPSESEVKRMIETYPIDLKESEE